MALASGLYHLGLENEASAIVIQCQEMHMEPHRRNAFKFYQSKILGVLKKKHGKVKVARPYYVPSDLSQRSPNPVVVSLKVKQGKQLARINHCVCFVGDYIFDANRDNALPIDVSSLNLICSDILPGATYDGIYWARQLVLLTNK